MGQPALPNSGSVQVLAEQHFKGLSRLVERMPESHRPRIAILTGSAKLREKRKVHEALAAGDIDILIGTHALVSDSVRFARLGMAVIDEQHK